MIEIVVIFGSRCETVSMSVHAVIRTFIIILPNLQRCTFASYAKCGLTIIINLKIVKTEYTKKEKFRYLHTLHTVLITGCLLTINALSKLAVFLVTVNCECDVLDITYTYCPGLVWNIYCLADQQVPQGPWVMWFFSFFYLRDKSQEHPRMMDKQS